MSSFFEFQREPFKEIKKYESRFRKENKVTIYLLGKDDSKGMDVFNMISSIFPTIFFKLVKLTLKEFYVKDFNEDQASILITPNTTDEISSHFFIESEKHERKLIIGFQKFPIRLGFNIKSSGKSPILHFGYQNLNDQNIPYNFDDANRFSIITLSQWLSIIIEDPSIIIPLDTTLFKDQAWIDFGTFSDKYWDKSRKPPEFLYFDSHFPFKKNLGKPLFKPKIIDPNQRVDILPI